uniref:Uncharacterized protein n=1 Tax=Neisseria meningitidis alpha275 TaxID=295996 RepID=C6SHZ8_NEIME|nr:hypothetical protein predicted by Glimmer/Critica [Neisseria meningitidis alpha275]
MEELKAHGLDSRFGASATASSAAANCTAKSILR